MNEHSLTRRGFLASLGAVAAGTALSGRARALPREGEQPEHVTITYDEDTLLKYRPRLVFADDEYEKFLNLHGFVARSTEDTLADVCVYWAEYTHQTGVSDYDSHDGDHEPLYVFLDSSTGEVEKVVYSAYHWMRATSLNPAMDGTHPLFRVVDKWHQYQRTETVGRLTTLADLTKSFKGWLDDGLDAALAPGTVVNPWLMTDREHWWRRGTFGVSWDALYVDILHTLGRHKAAESDI